MTWELPVVRSVRSVSCKSISRGAFSRLTGAQFDLNFVAGRPLLPDQGRAPRRFQFDAHFFSSLDLDDLRIVDSDLHRAEAQVLQRLQYCLFDAGGIISRHLRSPR